MKVIVSSAFQAPAELIWTLVKKSATLVYVTKGVLAFTGSSTFPEQWQQGHTVDSSLRFFGWLPGWRHQITFVKIDDDQRILSTNEGGGLVSVWNHQIRVVADAEGISRYVDEVDIRAGIVTPLVWGYAQCLYRYRQWRWKSLLASSLVV
ncbi:hypothetical protein A9Q99_17900 [Gammaproteobacteria bacterium 45_16_T64]|nr:hypothetical protein A9Q99_17900 [Gammaproteobacteria bacterium 45_16_T64]